MIHIIRVILLDISSHLTFTMFSTFIYWLCIANVEQPLMYIYNGFVLCLTQVWRDEQSAYISLINQTYVSVVEKTNWDVFACFGLS